MPKNEFQASLALAGRIYFPFSVNSPCFILKVLNTLLTEGFFLQKLRPVASTWLSEHWNISGHLVTKDMTMSVVNMS